MVGIAKEQISVGIGVEGRGSVVFHRDAHGLSINGEVGTTRINGNGLSPGSAGERERQK
jgi:hypothetical protein